MCVAAAPFTAGTCVICTSQINGRNDHCRVIKVQSERNLQEKWNAVKVDFIYSIT